uniref:Uncharacterized protein n=1 Tax=Moniliophthora roreri TaxID=221103 RepID=A0A0W0FG99_MONRR
MSFQSFRLGEMAMQQPLPPHLLQLQAGSSSQQFPGTADNTNSSAKIGQRAPYGSGDSDDGYTLVFPNLTAFFEWKEKEEEAQVVEFGDTHGSKAVPPRFKEHTKLVCARHSRSGRKKYVKKHPERVRKVPSRKIEGGGCPASISYKTYFDTDEVRACYISQHSHEIGLANLPFTRKGRKQAAEQKTNRRRTQTEEPTPTSGPPVSSQAQPTTSFSVPMIPQQQHPPATVHYQPPQPQPFGYQPPYPAPPPQAPGASFGQDRWQNMETLFHSIRDQARTFAYPVASVAALESVLIRLFLESPSQQPVAVAHHHQTPGPPQPQPPPQQQQHQHIPGGEEEDESGSDESS